MSNLAHRAATVPRWSDLPLTRASKSYFLLGQNARGLWVIRENTGKKAGVFVLNGTFRYQACDDQVCYIAKSVRLTWDVTIR